METVTSTTLLEAIKHSGDDHAWSRFTERYRPMVVSFALRLGLRASDAEDVAQETLMAFFDSYREGRFDHQRGRLRSWLFSIARCNVVDVQRRNGREFTLLARAGAAGFLQEEIPDPLERVWDQEWHGAVVNACLAEIARETTLQTVEIFRLYVLEKWPADRIAGQFKVSLETVYLVKNRLTKKFKGKVARMEEIW